MSEDVGFEDDAGPIRGLFMDLRRRCWSGVGRSSGGIGEPRAIVSARIADGVGPQIRRMVQLQSASRPSSSLNALYPSQKIKMHAQRQFEREVEHRKRRNNVGTVQRIAWLTFLLPIFPEPSDRLINVEPVMP